ncbi:MAG: hypothetical protein P4L84_33665 [Isosphaeraceae bacterium]|nr:hypothetical protein [Isosphaeraceae bacterium]
MGLEICFTDGDNGEDYYFSLATASGWSLFGDWVDTLPQNEFAGLAELVNEGEYKGTDVLSEQLKKALAEHRPKDRNVAKTARHLLKLMGYGAPVDTARVVNEDDDDDDDDDDEDDLDE